MNKLPNLLLENFRFPCPFENLDTLESILEFLKELITSSSNCDIDKQLYYCKHEMSLEKSKLMVTVRI
jgi:hypothetical protein